jgi:hypothetical protein
MTSQARIAELQASNVTSVFFDCFFTDDEITEANGECPKGAVVVEGIMSKFAFHPGRLEKNSGRIKSMVACLPSEFQKGWTFLNMCMDKNDRQWTDTHQQQEQLLVLGIATGCMSVCLSDRELWSAFPGGMPYVQVHADQLAATARGEEDEN